MTQNSQNSPQFPNPKMDTDISRWVLEFLLRSSVPDSLIQKTLAVLPLSGADNRLKKTLLLRTLQSQHSKASVTETALEILELLEELDRNDAVPVTDAIRRAYCAVAVECTVKYLAASPDDAAGEYFAAVKRIWRGRVTEMEAEEEGRRSELLSGELTRWRDDIEAALWDSRVSERLAGLNSRRDALNKVKMYLKEAWEIMGPSFLDSVAKAKKGLCPEGVCEFASGGEAVRERGGGLEGSGKERRDSVVGGDRSESDDDDGACCMEDDVSVKGGDQGKEQVEERVGGFVDGDQEVGGCELPAQVEKDVKGENQGNEQLEERVEVSSVDANEEVGGCDLPAQGDNDVEGENQGKEQLEERVGTSVDGNQEVGGCDLPPQGDKAIQKGNLQLKRKHSALRTCHRGVKISGVEEVEPAKSLSRHDPVPSAEVKKVRESLKSSSLELRALVKDPLPDALHTSEVVRSKLATKDINLEPPIENQNGFVDVPARDVCMSIVPFRPNDANLGKKSSVHCSNVHCPNLMERRSTARTYEWNDSIDNLPQERQPRRRKRKWTSLEEETLRAGVKMFGEGNWATIRNFYSNIFENRSGVDLKDKWRNMIR